MVPLARAGSTSAYYATMAEIGAFTHGSLPVATTSTVGAVKPDGSTLTVDADGTLHGAVGVTQWNGRTGSVALTLTDVTGVGGAPLASPALSGTPTSTTPLSTDNSTKIATTAFVQTFVATANAGTSQAAYDNAGRNVLHNALFNIAQRGTGPFTANGAYTLDRWQIVVGGSSVTVSQQPANDTNRTQIGDEAAQFLLGSVCTGTAGAGDLVLVQQPIENVRRLASKTVTISFWAASTTGTPKLGVQLSQHFGTGGSPSTDVDLTGTAVTLSTTFARYSVTVALPSIAGKTLGSNNDHCTTLRFWQSTGATNNTLSGGVGVQSYTLFLWGVQLEIGSVATPLDYGGSSADQLQQCQRYYQTGFGGCGGYAVAGVTAQVVGTLPVVMRATPTFTSTPGTQTNTTGAAVGAFGGPGNYVATASVTATGGFNFWASFTASADL